MKNYILIASIVLCSGSAIAAEIGKSEICKATIATAMGRKPSIIRTDKIDGGVEYLSYIRDDGSLWSYKCQVIGTEAFWSSDTGRLQQKARYKISSDRSQITITEIFDDGSENSKTFLAKNFK